jgi:dTDP-4-dehydrorhamnose 3,5-epimerase
MTPPSRFTVEKTALDGLKVIRRLPIQDSRGEFQRLYCNQELREAGLVKPVAQVNHSLTKKRGAVRGLHFQRPPHAEMKVVSCLRGRVFDVAVDLRPDSATYLKWHGEELSAENHASLLIPEGFAHGFQTLEGDTELVYLHTEPYVQASEDALNVNDPRLAIAWPLPITEISDRDRGHAFLSAAFQGVRP